MAVRKSMPDVINELAEKTTLPPAAVRKVMNEFAAMVDALGEGDRAAIGRGTTIVCRHRKTESGEPRRIVMVRKTKQGGKGRAGDKDPQEAA